MESTEAPAHPVRLAEPADLALLADIEGEADELFTSVFGDVDWDPPTEGERRAREPGLLLVAGRPAVGFVHVLFLEELHPDSPEQPARAAHLEQLCVRPAHMGRGVGSALLEEACRRAGDAGYRQLSLSTFAEVPWNGPFYAARGFHEVTDPLPYLRDLRTHEQAMGLDRHGPRVVMTRELDPTGVSVGGSS